MRGLKKGCEKKGAGSERDPTGSVSFSLCVLMFIEHGVGCNTAESLRGLPNMVWDPNGIGRDQCVPHRDPTGSTS
eukprot:11866669-Karenia_brevis.AAC.1